MRIRPRFIWPVIVVVLLALGAAIYPRFIPALRADSNTSPVEHVQIQRGTQPTYHFEAGIDGEIFPAFANYASLQRPKERQFGTFTVTIRNTTNSVLAERVSVLVPGWSDMELQNVSVGAGEVRKLLFAPAFLSRLYKNREIRPATAALRVTDATGHVLHTETIPIRLRSSEDLFWGENFKFAPFIASWVTPHDPRVESVLALAKEFMPGRRLPGYEEWKSAEAQRASTLAQAKAIYRAVQNSGLSYVKSSLTFGRNAGWSERVRLPHESLTRNSANCIDGVVMYASLFENLDMDPYIVLVPGHAYVAVRLAQNSDDYLYIETAITGRAPFEASVKAATRGMAKYAEKDITRIRVSQARAAGIFPMPLPGNDPRHLPMSESAAIQPNAAGQ